MQTILSFRNRATFILDEKGAWTMVKNGVSTPVTVTLSDNKRMVVAYHVI